VHRDEGDLQQDGVDAQEVEKIRPLDSIASYFRAELALSRGRWDEAEGHAGEALRRLGTEVDLSTRVWIAIAQAEALSGAGRPAEALRALG